jgi:hypothetical protein
MAKPDHRPDAVPRPWPALTGDAQTDSAVWHLSVVLREISKSQASDRKKPKPPSQTPIKGALTSDVFTHLLFHEQEHNRSRRACRGRKL